MTVPSAIVIVIACFWLAVWAVCLLMTLRFVVIVVAAGVMQAWESVKHRRKPKDATPDDKTLAA